jgi:hypothetical protein
MTMNANQSARPWHRNGNQHLGQKLSEETADSREDRAGISSQASFDRHEKACVSPDCFLASYAIGLPIDAVFFLRLAMPLVVGRV